MLIRWISCNNSRSKVLKAVIFDAQTIARSSCDSVKTPMEFDRCSHAIFHFFSKYLKTFNHKNKKIQADGCLTVAAGILARSEGVPKGTGTDQRSVKNALNNAELPP